MDLLIGATGTIGQNLLKKYSGRGDVKILVHSERSEFLVRELGFKNVHKGDGYDPKNLDLAFKGVERLFLLTPPQLNQPELELNFLETAKRAQVKRIVYISLQYTGSKPNIKITSFHEPAEEWLKNSGISYTALRPPSFLDNLLWQIDLIKQGNIIYAGVGDGRIAHIDTRDIADIAYAAMTDESLQGPVDITSDKAVTFDEIAEEITKHVGYKVTLIQPPANEWKKGLLANGMPDWYADALIEGMAYYAKQKPIVATGPISKIRKEGARSLEGFIKDKIVPLAKK